MVNVARFKVLPDRTSTKVAGATNGGSFRFTPGGGPSCFLSGLLWGAAVGLGVGVCVGVGLGVGVCVAVGLGVGVCVGVGFGVEVSVGLGVLVAVGMAVGVEGACLLSFEVRT
jgi:hypothetical protein